MEDDGESWQETKEKVKNFLLTNLIFSRLLKLNVFIASAVQEDSMEC